MDATSALGSLAGYAMAKVRDDWLTARGLQVLDERVNAARQWGTFAVDARGGSKKLDLLVGGRVATQTDQPLAGTHVAIEIEPCDKHGYVLDGFDQGIDLRNQVGT